MEIDEKIAPLSGGTLSMGYIQGEGRNQGTLFPVVLDDFVPTDHLCRVIDAFVCRELESPGVVGAMQENAGAWLGSARGFKRANRRQ